MGVWCDFASPACGRRFKEELDYKQERENCGYLRARLGPRYSRVVVPEPVPHLSSEHVTERALADSAVICVACHHLNGSLYRVEKVR